jgi:branched-chain amino acid transport system substrate-binding protein
VRAQRILTALTVGGALLLAACGAGGNEGKADIKVGAAISLTGIANVYGPAQQQGLRLAEERINAAGGVNGAKLRLLIEDDGSTKEQSITVFKKLVNEEKVAAILGPTLSGSASGAHPVAQQGKTPTIAISNTGAGIVGTCDYGPCDYIFRASLGEASAIPATIKAAKTKFNVQKVVLMWALDDKFSVDGSDIFRKELQANGILILKELRFGKGDPDLTSVVTSAKAANPDAIVDSSLAGPAVKILKAVKDQFPAGKLVIGGNGFNSPAIITQAGPAAQGAVSGTAWYKLNADPANKAFVDAFKARYSSDPDQFAAQAYAAVYILADALKRASNPNDHAAVKKALEGVKDLATPLGKFSFTADHDVKQQVYVVQVKGNDFVLLT